MLSREIAVYVEHYKKIFYDILEIDFKNEIVTIKIDDKNKQIPFRHCKKIQYTGVKDRNGKKIFEGDSNGIYCVIFENACFKLQTKKGNKVGNLSNYVNEFEVAGNIFENPELLK